MAIDVDARDALFDALEEDGAPLDAFLDWAESFLELNQLNSEVIHEIAYFFDAEPFEE